MLIDQAAMLTLRLHLMAKDSIADPALSERNGRQYLAWANALSRLLRELGLEGAEARPLSTPEILAKFEREKAARAATL
jgi:hypothetical protein